MQTRSILKLAMAGILASAYLAASQPSQTRVPSKPSITLDNTCSGGGGTCTCDGKCVASKDGCGCT